MIIVSGRMHVDPSNRGTLLEASLEAVARARSAEGCLDFVVAADPLDPSRVNVYEEWATEAQLLAFRGGGPSSESASLILRAEVYRHQVSRSGPA